MKLSILILLLAFPVFAQENRTNPVIPYVPYTEPVRKPAVDGMTPEQEAQLKATVEQFMADTDQKINEAIKRDNPNGLPKRDWVGEMPAHRFWRAYYRHYSPPERVRYTPRYIPLVRYYPLLSIRPIRCR